MKKYLLSAVAALALCGPAFANDQSIDPGLVQACVEGMRQFDLSNHVARGPNQNAKDAAKCQDMIARSLRGEPIQ
jgi:hypothetical protein